MILEDKFTLKAPIQKLWDTMLKPETLRACIPGAEKIEQIDEKTYDCIVKQKWDRFQCGSSLKSS